MNKTTIISINNNHPAYDFSRNICENARKLYNTANYIVRNLHSALYKASKNSRISKEEERILSDFRVNLRKIEKCDNARFFKKVKSAQKHGGLKAHALMRNESNKRSITDITYGNKYFIYSYYFIDKYLKDTNNKHYRSLPSQISQTVLRKLDKDWKSHFALIKAYNEEPGKFNGHPGLPGYKSNYATTSLTSQTAVFEIVNDKAYISFLGSKERINICIGSSSLYKEMDYIRCELIPNRNKFKLCVTFDDNIDIKLPTLPEKVLGIDLGVDNFMACFSNVPDMPSLLYKGKYLKSVNSFYNKQTQRLVSAITKGHKPTKGTISSKKLNSISENRENFFRDVFYKISHHLCRFCEPYGIQIIVIGSNSDWKQNIHLGKITNQNFVYIPYDKFKNIFVSVAQKYNIAVILREESYTSQSSLADKDNIPVYVKNNDSVDSFSGKRTKKDYKLSDGTIVNADINGAGNIIRKEYPELFENMTREFLVKKMQTIITVNIKDIYKNINLLPKKKYKQPKKVKLQTHIA